MANYSVTFKQQGVITSLIPALPHDYSPGPWTSFLERSNVGNKARSCQTRAIATLRRAKFDIRVRNSGTEKLVHGWTLPHQEDEYTPVTEARWSNKYLTILTILTILPLFGQKPGKMLKKILEPLDRLDHLASFPFFFFSGRNNPHRSE
ncbi:MAG: hypothetical protein WCD57_11470 [Acidobacteriaceae bacterium]